MNYLKAFVLLAGIALLAAGCGTTGSSSSQGNSGIKLNGYIDTGYQKRY